MKKFLRQADLLGLVLMASMLIAIGVVACGSMSTRERDTVIGAGVGTAVGAGVTGDVGGAAAGGVLGGLIGNQVGKH